MPEIKGDVRAQIDPRCLAILELVGCVVENGYVHGIVPKFRGVKLDQWIDLYDNHPDEYAELVTICESDFPTFCALLAKVVGKGAGGPQPYIFNNAQRFLWGRFVYRMRNRLPLFFVVLKSRQLGITTFMCAWHYWQIWRQSHIQTLMLGHVDMLAGRIMTIMRIFHDEMPDVGDIKPRLRQDTKKKTARVPKGEIYVTQRGDLAWNSWAIAGSARNVDQRGFQGTHFSGSECAFWPQLNNLKDALLPQLPPPGSPRYLDCSVMFESSPQGQNEFHELYQLGKNVDSKWEAVFLPWLIQDDEFAMMPPDDWKMTSDDKQKQKELTTERKKYDGKPVTREQMYWRHFTILNDYDGAEEAFDAEYASDDVTCFMLSKNMLFEKDMRYLHSCVNQRREESPKLLLDAGFKSEKEAVGEFSFEPLANPFMHAHFVKPAKPKFIYERRGNVTIWEPPQHGHIYIIGADGSGGDNDRDGAAAHVACVTCGREAAEFWDHVGPEEFTDQFYHLALMYNEALVNPEVNYLGTIILKRLMSGWGYGNVARTEQWDEIRLKKDKYGFMTTAQNKSVLIAAGVSMLKARYYRISGDDFLSELSTFQFDGLSAHTGREMFSAKWKKRDDRVIAYCLAMYAVRQSPKLYSQITTHQHSMPTAVELRINRSALPATNTGTMMSKEFIDALPTELKNIFDSDGITEQNMSANPIRGYMGGWR